jgi:hypothetical protein
LTGIEINPAFAVLFDVFSSWHRVIKEGVVLVGVPEVPRLEHDEAAQVGTADSV